MGTCSKHTQHMMPCIMCDIEQSLEQENKLAAYTKTIVELMGKVNRLEEEKREQSTQVMVPKQLLDDLEEARKGLFEEGVDRWLQHRLHRVTGVIDRLANTKWPMVYFKR